MNDNVMYQKIPATISHNAKPNCLHPPYIVKCAEINQKDTWYSKDDKERIVLFKKTRLHLVMIFMQIPQESMHEITMGKPCNTFHNYKSCSKHKYVKNPGHLY